MSSGSASAAPRRHHVVGGMGRSRPLLADDFDVIVPTLPGHRGGPKMPDASFRGPRRLRRGSSMGRTSGPCTSRATRLVGGSRSGLARRGRARSVCGLSPAGFWPEGGPTPRGGDGASTDATARAADFVPCARRRRDWTGPQRGDGAGGRTRRPDELAAGTGRAARQRVGSRGRVLSLFRGRAARADGSAPMPVTLAWSGKDRIFRRPLAPSRRDGFPAASRLSPTSGACR